MFVRILALLLATSSLLLTTPTFAQTASPSSISKESTSVGTKPTFEVSQAISPTTNYQLPTTISPTSPLYTDLLVNNMFHTFSCLAIGQSIIGQPCLTYQLTQNGQGITQGVPVLSQTNLSGGTLGAVTSVIGMLYENPPVRSTDYLASIGAGLGIAKEAKAQGVGGSGAAVLNPILQLWQVSRNIAYILLILIFIVIGLMVMFRNKINPQTVITAQAALPGLVIGLIMITFSYFFAGLLSDMAFVGTNLVGYYFSAAQNPSQPPQDLVADLKDENVLSIFSPLIGIISREDATSLVDILWTALNEDTQRFLTGASAFLIGQMASPVGSLFGPIGQLIVGFGTAAATVAFPTFMVGTLLWIIATLILLYAMFKLLLRLINNYVTIIFLTFTAPFQFLVAALPGRQGIATNWMLNMLANILAFPAVLAVLYFVVFLLPPGVRNDKCPQVPNSPCPFKVSSSQPNRNGLVYAQGIQQGKATVAGSQTFPLFGGMDISFLNLILAFGALIALPSVPDILGRTIGKMGATGQLIGQEIGGGVGQGRNYFGQASRAPGALAGQIGPVTNQRGWAYNEKLKRWESSRAPMSGAKAGLGSQIAGYFRRAPTPPHKEKEAEL